MRYLVTNEKVSSPIPSFTVLCSLLPPPSLGDGAETNAMVELDGTNPQELGVLNCKKLGLANY